MKISKLIILASICTTLAGCANMQPMPKKPVDRWFKDGVSADAVKSKHAKCTYNVG